MAPSKVTKRNRWSWKVTGRGNGNGNGEATARYLAARGHNVILGARRTDRLELLANEIRATGGEIEFRALDVTDRADMQAFADFAVEKFGRIDVLVNNAGVIAAFCLARTQNRGMEPHDRREHSRRFARHRGVLHGMRERKSGQIINVSSIGAHRVSPTAAVYDDRKRM